MVKEIQETNEYQSEIIDQFKNEFKQITISGDSIYIPDAAELPMELVPYGEPVQTVIPEELGTTVEGESVVVTDGDIDKEVKATVNGNSYQETTEGYNLVEDTKLKKDFNIDSVVNGLVTTKAINSNFNVFNILYEKNIDINSEKIMYTSFKIRLKSGNYSKSLNGYINILSEGEVVAQRVNTINNPVINNSFQEYKFSVKFVKSGTLKPVFQLQVIDEISNAVFEIKDIMLSQENKPYEPYTGGQASPNTDYPSEIEVITECSLVQRGKNYCNAINQNYYLNTYVDGCGNITGNNGLIIPINDNTKMTISSQVVQARFRVACINELPTLGAGTNVVAYNGVNLDNNSTIKTTINTTGYKYLVVNATDLTVIQIEQGSIATDYEPYHEPIVHSIDLAGEKLAKVGEIADLLKIARNGSVKIGDKVIKEYVFTGDENWQVASNTQGLFRAYLEDASLFSMANSSTNSFLVNRLQKVEGNIGSYNTDKETLAIRDSLTGFQITLKNITSIDEFKQWLKDNSTYVLYQTKQAETINLPSIEPITLFEGTNVFELVTNLGTTMAVTYNYVTPSPSIDRPSEILTVKGSYSTELQNEYATITNTLPLTLTNELLGEIVTLTEEEAKQLNLDGAGKYRRTDYGRYVFTGDETFNAYPYGVNSYSTKVITDNLFKTDEIMVISNYFIGVSNDNRDASMKNKIYSASSATTIFRDTDFATVDEFQTFLKSLYNAGTPTETIYKLATPTYEKITDETELQQLSAYDKQVSFFGVNNINTYPTDDLVKAPLKIHATYSKSNKLTIQSLEDRLASLESQVTNLQDNQI